MFDTFFLTRNKIACKIFSYISYLLKKKNKFKIKTPTLPNISYYFTYYR